METTLIIARHGNTFNKNQTPTRIGKHTDLPLAKSGEQQAALLGQYLLSHNLIPDVVFASSLQRTQQTAAIALQTVGQISNMLPEHIFDEIDYGPDENKTEAEVIARIGLDAITAWDTSAIVPPDWRVNPAELIQHWIDFAARCVTDYSNQIILVVTSNGVARFAPHLCGDFEAFTKTHHIKLSTGALGMLQHDGKNWRINSWNVKPKDTHE